jgi:hypothetical protein
MKPFPHTPELLRAAKRIVWFKRPEEALDNPVELLAYAMRHSTDEDMALLLEHIGESGCGKQSTTPQRGSSTLAPGPIGMRRSAGTQRRQRRSATCGDRGDKSTGGGMPHPVLETRGLTIRFGGPRRRRRGERRFPCRHADGHRRPNGAARPPTST